MSILQQIQRDVVEAMKARDGERTTALRMVVSELQKAAKESQGELSEQDEIAVLSRERKKRAEAQEAYEQAGADERAALEASQLAMIEGYLPAQLAESEVQVLVDEAIAQTGAEGPAQMGLVMKALMPKIAGRADGKIVSRLVNARLASK